MLKPITNQLSYVCSCEPGLVTYVFLASVYTGCYLVTIVKSETEKMLRLFSEEPDSSFGVFLATDMEQDGNDRLPSASCLMFM